MDLVKDGLTLRLVGRFDGRSTAQVRETLHRTIDDAVHEGEDVVVDLDGVHATDLAALRMLAAATRIARRAGIHVILRGTQPAVRRLIHLAHLRHLVEVVPAGARSAAPAVPAQDGPASAADDEVRTA